MCVCVCVCHRSVCGELAKSSQVKPSQVKLSCYLLVERYRRRLPLNYRERVWVSEWVSEWVRGSVTLNKILACFYSFSHTQATVLLTDWLLTVRSSLSLLLSLLLLLFFFGSIVIARQSMETDDTKIILITGSTQSMIIHCKKKMPPL